MQGGYIKLHRKLLEWCWYDDDTVFRLFIHILLKANYRAVKWHDITIEARATAYKYSQAERGTAQRTQYDCKSY